MAERMVGRRQTLKYLGMLTGTAAGRQFLAGWLPARSALVESNAHAHAGHMHGADGSTVPQPDDAASYTPRFFKLDEFKTVEALTELIIPSDDTPGAREAQVGRYIDFVVSAAAEFKPSVQREWTDGLKLVDRMSREKHERPFHGISISDQEALLAAMSLPEREPNVSQLGFDFYRLVKDMTVEGFYTSREGLIDVLGYNGLDVLTEFSGCTHPEHQA